MVLRINRKKLLLKCFESIIKDDPVKYKNVRFEN